MLQQPPRQHHVARVAQGKIQRRQPVRTARFGRDAVVHVRPRGNQHPGSGQHVLAQFRTGVDPPRHGEVVDRPLRPDGPDRPFRCSGKPLRHRRPVVQRDLDPRKPAGQVRGFPQQVFDHVVLPMADGDLQPLLPPGAVQPLGLGGQLQLRPAFEIGLARDDVQVIGVLRHLGQRPDLGRHALACMAIAASNAFFSALARRLSLSRESVIPASPDRCPKGPPAFGLKKNRRNVGLSLGGAGTAFRGPGCRPRAAGPRIAVGAGPVKFRAPPTKKTAAPKRRSL